jgi:hypothetical protein
MAFILKCPGCQSPLRIREEYAGKQLKCPRCTHVMSVPSEAPAGAEAVPHAAAPPPARLREDIQPRDRKKPPPLPPDDAFGEGEPPPPPARVLPRRDEEDDRDDDRDDDRGRRRDRVAYRPCPRCSCPDVSRVVWTFWGSFYGPAMFHHVRCRDCGYTYNGKTGRSNVIPAIFFVTIPALLIAVILGGLTLVLISAFRR